jgi:hypothetical protein
MRSAIGMFLIFWVLSNSTSKAQEHAPLLATCEADVALWFFDLRCEKHREPSVHKWAWL